MQIIMDSAPGCETIVQSGFAPRRHYDTSTNSGNTTGYMSNGDVHHCEVNGVVIRNSHRPKVAPFPFGKKFHKPNSAPANKVSLEDSLKLTDANSYAMKTPVSLLQEILSRRGITPNYELVQIEGAIHEPTFRYRVSFNDADVPFTAMGAGRSKKEAKHAAARALIDKLTGGPLMDSQANVCNNTTVAPESYACMNLNANIAGSGDGADKVVGNPIGWLQEMCMSRRWPPPSYETETEIGLPHERLFTIACSILNFREVGKGKSKKVAKRMAAHKMWTRLQENPIDNNIICDSIQSEFDSDKTYYGDLKDISVPIITSQHSSKVSQFHKTLKHASGKKLLRLQKICLANNNINYIELLADIALENEFEVTYVDIEEKTFSDQYQCLVQISTLPVGVCHGSGPTPTDAQRQAAQNALEYLKIMTKK